MRVTTILIASGLLLMSGLVVAAPSGEEALALDLTAVPGGSTYFLKCSRWGPGPGQEHTFTNCGIASLWQQSNGVPGLQSSIFSYGGRAHPRDHNLLG